MNITEAVKNFLDQPNINPEKDSSVVKKDDTLIDLSNDVYPNTGSFFDDESTSAFNQHSVSDVILKQKDKIMKYRQAAMIPDVNDALDEIVNEIIFSYDDKESITLDVNIENKKLVQEINKRFEKIINLMNVKRNLFQLVKRSYIDGQINIHLAYDDKNTKNGIKAIKMIEPCYLYFDGKDNKFKYMHSEDSFMNIMSTNNKNEYDIEELVREDFGLYDSNINLSYLEYAIKPANMLKTLEDLLIPLRFSRSISRRVFNVDIGDLPGKRGAEVMREHQRKFKYKKFYNNETGEVSNQQHITSMVEDYWFSNRSGGKGTQVDVLDESGNLGELNDILYFSRKLYRSLKIPTSRLSIDPESDHEFDYDTTRVSKDDMKFFMFISRIRQVYSSLFREILKREIISTGVMTEQEWDSYENDFRVVFTNENKFIEKMKLANFMEKIDIYSTAQEYSGKLFSVETLLKDIFRMSEEEIKEEFEKIQEEEKNPLFSKFYKEDDEQGW